MNFDLQYVSLSDLGRGLFDILDNIALPSPTPLYRSALGIFMPFATPHHSGNLWYSLDL